MLKLLWEVNNNVSNYKYIIKETNLFLVNEYDNDCDVLLTLSHEYEYSWSDDLGNFIIDTTKEKIELVSAIYDIKLDITHLSNDEKNDTIAKCVADIKADLIKQFDSLESKLF